MSSYIDYTNGSITYDREDYDVKLRFMIDLFDEFGTILDVLSSIKGSKTSLESVKSRYEDAIKSLNEINEQKTHVPGIQLSYEEMMELESTRLAELERAEQQFLSNRFK